MLKHKKLLIDKDCPMCKLYGTCFTKLGWIEKNTLAPYQSIDNVHASQIDMERAKNEIAFYDTKTMKTIYGLDAMIAIVGHRFPALGVVSKIPFIYAFLLRLYRFISYNRKVIYPSIPGFGERACEPEVNRKYRWLYIILSVVFTGWVLNLFAFSLSRSFGFEHHEFREYLVAFGQVPWQLAIVYSIGKSKSLDYLGNMSTVSVIGALLLLPVLFLHAYFVLSPWILVGSFMAIVGVIFLEHVRRCKLLGLPFVMTVSWVAYRIVVLGIVGYLMLYLGG